MHAAMMGWVRASFLAVALVAAGGARAAPRVFSTATNCQVTSVTAAPTGWIGFRLGIDCMQANLGLNVNARMTLTCDSGPLEVYFGLQGASALSQSDTLLLTQINNSLNLGKRFQAITYYPYSYAFDAALTDTCQEQRTVLGLAMSGQANVLQAFKL